MDYSVDYSSRGINRESISEEIILLKKEGKHLLERCIERSFERDSLRVLFMERAEESRSEKASSIILSNLPR